MAAMALIDGLILNEFSERRAGLLASMELGPVYRENAEYLYPCCWQMHIRPWSS